MDPNLWGPHLWYFLHTLTYQFPIQPTWNDKQHMNEFLVSLEHILPCEHCKFHYKNYLLDFPPILDNQTQFIIWMIQLHNFVNQRLGKPQKEYAEVLEFYQAVFNGKQDYMPQKCPVQELNEFYKKGCIVLAVISAFLLFFIFLQNRPTISRNRL